MLQVSHNLKAEHHFTMQEVLLSGLCGPSSRSLRLRARKAFNRKERKGDPQRTQRKRAIGVLNRSKCKLRPENQTIRDFPLTLTDTNLASAIKPIVSITNLIKQFGRFAALRGVSADFAPGKLYAILGDNGAGKTTLLRMLAGLTQPTQGKISILGASDIRSVCEQIGYMAHPSLLYDELSGMENLRYFAGLYGIEDDQHCASVIAAVKLDPTLVRPVGQYSQGMRQRMSLARALLNDPKILLLDEPFSNVDTRSAGEMVSLLAQMRDTGKTIFVVTHQAALLEHVADEFIKMDAGKIVSRTPDLQPEELR
jgi:ABC-type multidrug transport system ATPase subunit